MVYRDLFLNSDAAKLRRDDVWRKCGGCSVHMTRYDSSLELPLVFGTHWLASLTTPQQNGMASWDPFLGQIGLHADHMNVSPVRCFIPAFSYHDPLETGIHHSHGAPRDNTRGT